MKIYCARRHEDLDNPDNFIGRDIWIRCTYRHMPRYIKILSKEQSDKYEYVYHIVEAGQAFIDNPGLIYSYFPRSYCEEMQQKLLNGDNFAFNKQVFNFTICPQKDLEIITPLDILTNEEVNQLVLGE